MSVPAVIVGYRAFRLPRQGHGLEECQDAQAGSVERGRFAVADGAAESPYSALWAQLLVEEFVRQSERLPNWASWLPSLQERWTVQVVPPPTPALPHKWGGRIRQAPSPLVGEGLSHGSIFPAWLPPSPLVGEGWSGGEPHGSGVPWYLEPGLTQGAFATFLGLVIEDGNWSAAAVGDSCLFQVRQGELIRCFPVERSADFSNAPWLVGSRTSPSEVPYKNGVQQRGDCRPGDRLWLMTDALAHWFLMAVESASKPWLALEPFGNVDAEDTDTQQVFASWIEEMRATRQLRNDDVTLLAISL